MKYAFVALGMLASLALASCNDFYTKEGYRFDMRKRLGHFAEAPFTDLYKEYAVAFIAPNFPGRDADDYRNYRPSADVCRNFFSTFIGQQHKLEELDQVVVLDACLGYVVDGVYKEDPDASEDDKAQFDSLAQEPKITSLYQTKLGQMGTGERTCVAHLLLNSVLAKKQFPNLVCNNMMLQLYIDFAECQEDTELSSHKEEDPYVKLVYELVKSRVQKCVEVEITHINNAVRDKFGEEWYKRRALKFSTKKGHKQQLERKWPTAMVTILGAVQNTTTEINVRQVHQLLSSVQHNDSIMKKRFLDNIAYFADKKIKLDKNKLVTSFNGQKYTELIDKVCNFFRSSDSEKDYDFATPIIRLVELLNHVELFDVTRDNFVKQILSYSYESAPLYLSVSACNLLTFTEASVVGGMANPHFEVHFQPNTSKMVSWPKSPYV